MVQKRAPGCVVVKLRLRLCAVDMVAWSQRAGADLQWPRKWAVRSSLWKVGGKVEAGGVAASRGRASRAEAGPEERIEQMLRQRTSQLR